MTDAEVTALETARTSLVTAYAAVAATPGPNYTKGNQTFAKSDYMKDLLQQITDLDDLLLARGGEPTFDVVSQGIT